MPHTPMHDDDDESDDDRDPEDPDPSDQDSPDSLDRGTTDCPHCGHEIDEEATWCHACGELLEEKDRPNLSTILMIIAIAIAMTFLAIVIHSS